MRNITLTLVLLFSAVQNLSAQLYADFVTTAGNFTCELNFKDTPRTVGNFVGLAEGTRPWVNLTNGALSSVRPPTPFYNGTTFHRVVNVTGFRIIQGGSRNALGTDDPGYIFPDEIKEDVPATYLFDQPYYLAMANAGFNTNGSQFFITGNAIPSLEKKHTVFGKVVSGTAAIEAILAAPTSPTDKPLADIVIQSVTIRRVGKAATAFKALKQKLPILNRPKAAIVPSPTANAIRLKVNQPAKSIWTTWTTNQPLPTDSSVWTYAGARWSAPPLTKVLPKFFDISYSASAPITGVRSIVTRYPDSHVPGTIVGYNLMFVNSAGTFLFTFPKDGAYAGSLTESGQPSKSSYLTKANPYFPEGYSFDTNGYAIDLIMLPETEIPPMRVHLAVDQKVGSSLRGRLTSWFWDGYQLVPLAGNQGFILDPIR